MSLFRSFSNRTIDSSGIPQPTSWRRVPATSEYWKALGIFFIYSAVFALSLLGSQVADELAQTEWIAIALAVVALGIPMFVLIWGAIVASRQIHQKTGYLTSPDGLILMLFATGIAAAVIGLPFAITAWAFTPVGMPLVVWVYLGILQRRLAASFEPTKPDRIVRSA